LRGEANEICLRRRTQQPATNQPALPDYERQPTRLSIGWQVIGTITEKRAYRSRPMSRRQRKDLIVPTHIREQFRLSLGSYGRPRMTEELKELGLGVGHRRVGRLMRQNGIAVVRTRKHKVTTDSNHKFNIAPNLLNRDFFAEKPNQKWAGDISYIWTREGWLYLAVVLDLHSEWGNRSAAAAIWVLNIWWLFRGRSRPDNPGCPDPERPR